MIHHLSVFGNHRQSRATALVFTAAGIILGAWAALIPFVKAYHQLDDGALGLFLLTMPAGVVVMNPFSVPIMHRLGTVRTTLAFLVLSSLLFAVVFRMEELSTTILSLFLAGASYSCLNVAMNTIASQLEIHERVRIMSACHGCWSAGAMIGSALGAVLTGGGWSPFAWLSLVILLEFVTALALYRPLSGIPEESLPRKVSDVGQPKAKRHFMMPNKALWALISISVCVNLTEGSMTDWSSVYMKEVVSVPEYMTGWGFSVYAFFMASGRFIGDAFINRFGSRKVLVAGGLMVSAGLAVIVLLPFPSSVLVGFAMVGFGVSTGSPVLYAAASKVPGMAKGAGLATMNTFAMIGFMGGPALIGWLARWFGLSVSFAFILLVAVFWSWRAYVLGKDEFQADGGEAAG